MHLVTLYKHRLPTIGTAFISHLVKEMGMMEVMSKRTMKRMTLLSDFSPSSKSQMILVCKSDDSSGNDTINDNKLTKLGRCDRETIELANNSNDSIVRTAGRASK